MSKQKPDTHDDDLLPEEAYVTPAAPPEKRHLLGIVYVKASEMSRVEVTSGKAGVWFCLHSGFRPYVSVFWERGG